MAKRSYLYLGIFLWTLTIIFVIAPIWPYVFYRLSPQTSEVLASTIGNTIAETPRSAQREEPSVALAKEVEPPPFDLSLPEENGLVIDKIGVRSEIREGENWSDILRKGIWRVPSFGTPESNGLPIILAAHRFGYATWTSSFRTLNSFYNLPKLKVGDQVEVIWNQRKYVYEIYQEETGIKITDYSANLILYTCELWNSPIRIFRYAKRATF